MKKFEITKETVLKYEMKVEFPEVFMPTLEEVQKYFKDALEIQGFFTGKTVKNSGDFFKLGRGWSLQVNDFMIVVWSPGRGYAKIISNKVPTLEIGQWYKSKISNCKACVKELLGGRFVGYGFDVNGNYINSFNQWTSDPSNWEKATDQEVKELLEKEAVKLGFGKKGVYFESPIKKGFQISEIEGFDFWNISNGPSLNCKFSIAVREDGGVIFSSGVWATILSQEEILKKLNK